MDANLHNGVADWDVLRDMDAVGLFVEDRRVVISVLHGDFDAANGLFARLTVVLRHYQQCVLVLLFPVQRLGGELSVARIDEKLLVGIAALDSVRDFGISLRVTICPNEIFFSSFYFLFFIFLFFYFFIFLFFHFFSL